MLDRMTDLVLDVNEADGGNYVIPDDADFYALLLEEKGGLDEILGAVALYEMGETFQGKPVMEIVAFTSPGYRNQGFLDLLLDSLEDRLKGFSVRLALYPDTAAPETLAALKSIGAFHDHDELLMACSVFDLPRQEGSTIPLTINPEPYDDKTLKDAEGKSENEHTGKLQAEGKGSKEDATETQADREQCFLVTTPYGQCHCRLIMQNAYIYGILTYERFQKKGYAYLMLKGLFSYLEKKGAENITLEVSAQNIPAVKLYNKLGFKVIERLSYYYLGQARS